MKKDKVLFSISHLQKYFPIKKTNIFQKTQDYVKANKDISIDIYEGETLGIVGESGCGKSTFGRTMIQLQRQTGGSSLYYGDSIENFMPSYVKEIFKSLAKTSFSYDADRQKFKDLRQVYEEADESKKEAAWEAFRLHRIDFDNKYGNTLRLCGGLVTHPDLDRVSRVLLERYENGAALAKIIRDINLEEERKALNPSLKTETLERLEKDLNSLKREKELIDEKVNQLKEEAKHHRKFAYYESKLDDGIDLSSLNAKESRTLRKDLQIIFQDPYSSLDPRFTVADIIGEGLLTHKLFKSKHSKDYEAYILDIMAKCGLDKEYIHRFPHQFSGGQRQRIGIARALALKPKFIVCDEAVSALDVSIQSQIINLLSDLKREHNLTYLFITHDLGVVRYISDRIGVMYFGNLVELASAKDIFDNPQHPYTKQLLNAIPMMEDEDHPVSVWDIAYENDIFSFHYHETGETDSDWYEAAPGHFVACTLKERDQKMLSEGVPL